MRVTMSGEGDFEVTAEEVWRVEVRTDYSFITVSLRDGETILAVNGVEQVIR
jgi:hypothetical protein